MKKQKVINIKTTIGMLLATQYIAKYDLDSQYDPYSESQLVSKEKEELEKHNKKNKEVEGLSAFEQMVMYTFELIVDDVVVGYAVKLLNSQSNILKCLFISKEYRNQGYASLLMDEFIQSKEAKVTFISLGKYAESNCMFFTKWGFNNVFPVIERGVLARESWEEIQKVTHICCWYPTIKEYFNEIMAVNYMSH